MLSNNGLRSLIEQQQIANKNIERLRNRPGNVNLGDIVASFQYLPNLRGFWPMTARASSGAVTDLSGNGLTLTATATVAFAAYNDLMGYCDYDGATGKHARTTEANLEITGPLTVGGWFWVDAYDAVNAEGLVSKDGGSVNRAWALFDFSGLVTFVVSGDGTIANQDSVSSAAGSLPLSTWKFIVGRYAPSTEISLLVDDVETVNTTGIPASLFNSTQAFEIARTANSNSICLNGRASLVFLCNMYLEDVMCEHLYQSSRLIFQNA